MIQSIVFYTCVDPSSGWYDIFVFLSKSESFQHRFLDARSQFCTKISNSPGTVSVAIQHACAHIKSGDLRSDNEPTFRAQLALVLSTVASFFLKLRSGEDAPNLNGDFCPDYSKFLFSI